MAKERSGSTVCGGGGGGGTYTSFYRYSNGWENDYQDVNLSTGQRNSRTVADDGTETSFITGNPTSVGNTPKISVLMGSSTFTATASQIFPSAVPLDSSGNFNMQTSNGTVTIHINANQTSGSVTANSAYGPRTVGVVLNSDGSVTLTYAGQTVTEPAGSFPGPSMTTAQVAYAPQVLIDASDAAPLMVVADGRSKFIAVCEGVGAIAGAIMFTSSIPATMGISIVGAVGIYAGAVAIADDAENKWNQ